MHGAIMVELKNFVTQNYNRDTWESLLKNAGLWPRLYLPVSEYPDEEVKSLVKTASGMTGIAAPDLLESFGQFVAPGLLRMYRPLVRDDWRTLDLLENTETAIHTAIRLKDEKARPPQLKCERLAHDQVAITYASARRMCPVARGIAMGVATHFGDSITIGKEKCTARGDGNCRLLITLLNAPAAKAVPVLEANPEIAAPSSPQAAPEVRKVMPTPSAIPQSRPKKRRSLFDILLGRNKH